MVGREPEQPGEPLWVGSHTKAGNRGQQLLIYFRTALLRVQLCSWRIVKEMPEHLSMACTFFQRCWET